MNSKFSDELNSIEGAIARLKIQIQISGDPYYVASIPGQMRFHLDRLEAISKYGSAEDSSRAKRDWEELNLLQEEYNHGHLIKEINIRTMRKAHKEETIE